MLVALALRTGIAPAAWEAESSENILTALHLIEQGQRK